MKNKYIWIKDVKAGDIAVFRCGGDIVEVERNV
jgi:hypothetical protein